ncbi:hypothetical protein Micbo1qcDRAFT_39558 [Microdochium bolleyi]|uniref:Uncharacterized protein n=1 Tax=Microdochium bolleyi TaxID=196109 RepID=A0A136J9K3_9PEZI|nr:hypothetical protein Micbo1qcDRAFT_39558 [Microdochium bolleyi]
MAVQELYRTVREIRHAPRIKSCVHWLRSLLDSYLFCFLLAHFVSRACVNTGTFCVFFYCLAFFLVDMDRVYKDYYELKMKRE